MFALIRQWFAPVACPQSIARAQPSFRIIRVYPYLNPLLSLRLSSVGAQEFECEGPGWVTSRYSVGSA